MFVDAAALVAILSDEPEAERCSSAIQRNSGSFTSPIAVWETVVALARPDKLDLPIENSERLVMLFLEERGIALRDLPSASDVASLSLEAGRRFRTGKYRLNLADCFHYASAKHHGVPILSTADEFRFTDLETVS
jgi:ribonuclease VapC